MRVIQLLNKIANGEEVPKKIKINASILILNEKKDNYLYEENDEYYGDKLIHWFRLDDEVEIIDNEEKEKPLTKKDVEALGYACGEIKKCFENGWNKSLNNKSFEEDKKIENTSRFQYSMIPEWFRFKDSINTINNNFEKHQKAIKEIIDILNKGNKNE